MRSANSKRSYILGSILFPLVLAQFVRSYAGSNMNVAVNSIASDLGTDMHGVQIAITLFTLTMAALMIPGSKLTDIWGRKFTFRIGLIVYGLGALVGALAPGIGILYIGYSIMQGVGSALLIPPVYILATVNYTGTESRAKAFGGISAAGDRSCTRPASWRLLDYRDQLESFLHPTGPNRFADLRRGPPDLRSWRTGTKPKLDIIGTILSASGLFFVVFGILATGTYGWFSATVWILVAIGMIIIGLFFLHIRSAERGEVTAPIDPHIP